MSVTVSYPGIYIEELPLSAHAIAPAPTSIAAFVGYTHPLRTAAFNAAVEVFSFTDYENQFGGLYTSGIVDANVARAVFQFFQNGGSHAHVVGLQPKLLDASGGVLGTLVGQPVSTSPRQCRRSRRVTAWCSLRASLPTACR